MTSGDDVADGGSGERSPSVDKRADALSPTRRPEPTRWATGPSVLRDATVAVPDRSLDGGRPRPRGPMVRPRSNADGTNHDEGESPNRHERAEAQQQEPHVDESNSSGPAPPSPRASPSTCDAAQIHAPHQANGTAANQSPTRHPRGTAGDGDIDASPEAITRTLRLQADRGDHEPAASAWSRTMALRRWRVSPVNCSICAHDRPSSRSVRMARARRSRAAASAVSRASIFSPARAQASSPLLTTRSVSTAGTLRGAGATRRVGEQPRLGPDDRPHCRDER